MTPTAPARLPVTVVTGFLGAGKTTLLRQLLQHSGQRLAVVVNEFGEVGIDGDLIAACGFCPEEEIEGRLVELANGCLCCTVQDEFLPTMIQLLERADQLDGIVVETSGLALPEPLVAAFGWPEIRTRTRVSAVVTVVDGEALAAGHVVGDAGAVEAQRRADPSLDHLTAIEDLFEDQLSAADLVLVSRSDRLDPAALAGVTAQLRQRLRQETPVLPMVRGGIDPALILDQPEQVRRPRDHQPDAHSHPPDGHPSAAHSNEDRPDSEADRHRRPPDSSHASHDHDHDHDHDHHPHDHTHVAMTSLVVQREGDWQRQDLEARLRELLRDEPVLRLKGRLRQRGKRLPLQIQAVGARLECWYEAAPAGRMENAPALELVVLGAAADAERLRLAFESL